MNKNELIRLIQLSDDITGDDIANLRKLIKQYPYFQALYVINAKASANAAAIKKASVRSLDRGVLRKIINREFNPNITLPDLSSLDLHNEDINAFEQLMREDTDPPVREEHTPVTPDFLIGENQAASLLPGPIEKREDPHEAPVPDVQLPEQELQFEEQLSFISSPETEIINLPEQPETPENESTKIIVPTDHQAAEEIYIFKDPAFDVPEYLEKEPSFELPFDDTHSGNEEAHEIERPLNDANLEKTQLYPADNKEENSFFDDLAGSDSSSTGQEQTHEHGDHWIDEQRYEHFEPKDYLSEENLHETAKDTFTGIDYQPEEKPEAVEIGAGNAGSFFDDFIEKPIEPENTPLSGHQDAEPHDHGEHWFDERRYVHFEEQEYVAEAHAQQIPSEEFKTTLAAEIAELPGMESDAELNAQLTAETHSSENTAENEVVDPGADSFFDELTEQPVDKIAEPQEVKTSELSEPPKAEPHDEGNHAFDERRYFHREENDHLDYAEGEPETVEQPDDAVMHPQGEETEWTRTQTDNNAGIQAFAENQSNENPEEDNFFNALTEQPVQEISEPQDVKTSELSEPPKAEPHDEGNHAFDERRYFHWEESDHLDYAEGEPETVEQPADAVMHPQGEETEWTRTQTDNNAGIQSFAENQSNENPEEDNFFSALTDQPVHEISEPHGFPKAEPHDEGNHALDERRYFHWEENDHLDYAEGEPETVEQPDNIIIPPVAEKKQEASFFDEITPPETQREDASEDPKNPPHDFFDSSAVVTSIGVAGSGENQHSEQWAEHTEVSFFDEIPANVSEGETHNIAAELVPTESQEDRESTAQREYSQPEETQQKASLTPSVAGTPESAVVSETGNFFDDLSPAVDVYHGSQQAALEAWDQKTEIFNEDTTDPEALELDDYQWIDERRYFHPEETHLQQIQEQEADESAPETGNFFDELIEKRGDEEQLVASQEAWENKVALFNEEDHHDLHLPDERKYFHQQAEPFAEAEELPAVILPGVTEIPADHAGQQPVFDTEEFFFREEEQQDPQEIDTHNNYTVAIHPNPPPPGQLEPSVEKPSEGSFFDELEGVQKSTMEHEFTFIPTDFLEKEKYLAQLAEKWELAQAAEPELHVNGWLQTQFELMRPYQKMWFQTAAQLSAEFLDYKNQVEEKKHDNLTDRRQRQIQLIERFIKEMPRIKPPDAAAMESAEVEDLAKDSYVFKQELATEHLALICIKQGKKQKAIEIYEHLCLKYPDKSRYFANQIEELKKS